MNLFVFNELSGYFLVFFQLEAPARIFQQFSDGNDKFQAYSAINFKNFAMKTAKSH